MSFQFISVDVERCRAQGHHFRATWSDKHPMKVSLMCLDCTRHTKKNAYAAYGVDTLSHGQWRTVKYKDNEE